MNFHDSSGRFIPIDPTLRDVTEGGEDVSVDRANSVQLRLPKVLDDEGVSVETSTFSLSIAPAGALKSSEAPTASIPATARSTSATERAYPHAFDGATLTYESRNEGLKESIVLGEARAKTSFAFRVRLSGLTPKLMPDGSISLEDGSGTMQLVIPKPFMTDSSASMIGGDYSDAVHYELSGNGPEYRLVVVADPDWISDSARVFPVTIDPTVVTSATLASANDTFISSAYQSTNYSSHSLVWINNHDPGADYTEYGYTQPPSTLVSDMATKKSAGKYVVTSRLKMYFNYANIAVAGNITGYMVTTATASNLTTITWSGYNSAPYPGAGLATCSTPATNIVASGGNTKVLDVTGMAAYWQSASTTVSRCIAKIQGSTSTHVGFNSANNGSYKPVWEIEYAQTPTVTLSSPTTGTVTSIPNASWVMTDTGTGFPQAEWALEVATSSAGPAIASTGAANAATSSALPTPAAGWVPGTAYWVRVKAATSPSTQRPRFWSQWATGNFTPTLPSAVSGISYTTTASANWFTEIDSNGDGINDAKNDAPDYGRGSVSLSWPAASGATSYKVLMHDGYAYRQVASTTATSWSSAAKGIFPTDSQIASLSATTTANPLPAGSGLDLRDDPRALYAKTASASLDATPAYQFKVVAANGAGECASASPEALVVLDGRTTHVADEPRHAVYPLGDMLRHDASARLDEGSLELDIADLEIASWGPRAALTRHYSSDVTATSLFASGWRFGFEQSLSVSGTVAVWTDAVGDRHVFHQEAGVWVASVGSQDKLTSTGSGWKIAFVGAGALHFDSAGVLTGESDANGNTVTYLRTSGNLTIIAANGQLIDVTLDGTARPTSATYSTVDGTRSVTYEVAGSGTEATATLFAGSSDALPLHYSYSSGRLTSIQGPVTTFYNASGPSNQPAWSFTYTGGKLSGSFANSLPSYPTALGIGSGEATVTVYRDIDGQSLGQEAVVRYEINPSGTIARRSEPAALGDDWDGSRPAFDYWTDDYDVDNREIRETSPLGALRRSSYDSRGNLARTIDPVGAIETYTHDSNDRQLTHTDALGSTTYRTYDASGNLTVEERVLNSAGERSRTERTYNASGTLASERTKLSASEWAQTDYADFSSAGEAQTTVSQDVSISPSAAEDLISTTTCDAFGQMLSERDASGVWRTKSNAYSPSGRLLSSESVTGTVVHHAFNEIGHEIVTSTTAGAAVSGWERWNVDIRGVHTTEVRVDATGAMSSGSPIDLDPSGSVKRQAPAGATVDMGSSAPHDPRLTVTAYDVAGRSVKQWAPGADISDEASATRSVYDTVGRERATIAAGGDASHATTSTYDLAGRVVRVGAPDGTWTEFSHDAAGNVITEERSAASGSATKHFTYDLAGRRIATTDEDSGTVLATYDLAGRQVAGSVAGGAASSVTFNSLGWEISRTDNDGVVTARTFDGAGRERSVTVAGKTTTTEYDSAGRIVSVTSPDDRITTVGYDAFSRAVAQTQTVSGQVIKTAHNDFDEHGRMTASSGTGGGLSKSTTFADRSGVPASVSLAYGTASISVQCDPATGLESTRSASVSGTQTSRTVTRDAQGRPVRLGLGSGSQTLAVDESGRLVSASGRGYSGSGASYTFDDAGRKRAESVALAYPDTTFTASYSYTGAGRIATATIDGVSKAYSFDASGNLVHVSGSAAATLTYDLGNRLVSMGSTSYGWDTAHGWRTSEKRSGEQSVTLGFSDGGRLEAYRDPNRSIAATHSYDAQGQRTRSVVTSGSLTTTTTFVNDGLTLLSLSAERSDAATWSITYLTGDDGRPWAGVYSASDAAPVLFHLITNDRGDVVELTDATGTAFAAYRYDSWGNPTGFGVKSRTAGSLSAVLASQIAGRQVLRYAGYAFDEHSGMYYCSQRYYDPASCQWVSKDPARADGEESAYQYCGGDPVGKVDPSGLSYSPGGAAAYADRWALGGNPAFKMAPGNDCTNFTSQCILELPRSR